MLVGYNELTLNGRNRNRCYGGIHSLIDNTKKNSILIILIITVQDLQIQRISVRMKELGLMSLRSSYVNP